MTDLNKGQLIDNSTIKVNSSGQLYAASPDCFGSIVEQYDISENSDGSYFATLYESGLLVFAGTGYVKSDLGSNHPWNGNDIYAVCALNPIRIRSDGNFDMLFKQHQYLKDVGNLEFIVDGDTDFQRLFLADDNLISVGNLSFTANNGAQFYSMFEGCTQLETIGNLNFDVSGGEIEFNSMFNGTDALHKLGNINMRLVTQYDVNLIDLLVYKENLTTIGDLTLDITASNITLESMFANNNELVNNGAIKIHTWDTDQRPLYFSAHAMFANSPMWNFTDGFDVDFSNCDHSDFFTLIDGNTYLNKYDMAALTKIDDQAWNDEFGRSVVQG